MKTVKEFLEEGRLKQLTTGPSRSRTGLDRQRKDASERAAFRKAGMRRTQSGGSRQRFSSTSNKNEYSKTAITSYPSQSAYAKDAIPEKEQHFKDGKGVKSTKDRAIFLKRLKKQLKTTRTRRGVHAVDILPKGDYKKNDPKDSIPRGREFQRVVREVPQEVKNAGGKKGDKIVGKAAEVMPGSKNPEQGRKKRRKLYSKAIGATDWDPVTKVQVASVKEQKTFSQFIQESQKVLKTIDGKYSRRHPGVNIDASYDKATNRIRVNQLFVPPALRGKGIGKRVMKGLGKYADKNNMQITLRQDPDKGREEDLDNFYKKHGFVPNSGDSTTKDTHIRNPK
jgi:predicted GNAT family acetyltransferase